MNGQRWLGQGLLWFGFLMAALATVSKREFDLLPPAEKESLKGLSDDLSIPKADLLHLVNKPMAALDSGELNETVRQVNQWQLQNQEKTKELKEAGQPIPPQIHPQKKLDLIARRTAGLDNLWSTIDWLWYGLAMLIGVAGVVLLRSTGKSTSLDGEKSNRNIAAMTQTLQQLTANVEELYHRFDLLIPEDIVEFIDQRCVLHFNEFADSRDSLTQRFGLPAFAEIMSDFATAERWVNRSWCASADGYLDEAKESLAKALVLLQSAQNRLQVYEQGFQGRQ